MSAFVTVRFSEVLKFTIHYVFQVSKKNCINFDFNQNEKKIRNMWEIENFDLHFHLLVS